MRNEGEVKTDEKESDIKEKRQNSDGDGSVGGGEQRKKEDRMQSRRRE
jgi:hypothetical protein